VRGTIEKLPSGSWRITVSLGKDTATGKYVRSRETIEGTKKDAERKRTEMLRALDTGSYVKPTKMSVGEFLERWLRDYVGANIQKAKSREFYTSIVRVHLIPAMGSIALTRLTPARVQEYYRDRVEAGLSSTSVQGHHRTLHRALECAVKWGQVGRNVCDATEPPKRRRVEMKTWTPEESGRFLATARAAETRYYALFAAAIYTGLRQGELLGLRWQDVDLDAASLAVQQTLEKAGTAPRFGTPKTAKSRRTVALPGELVTTLRAWKATQNAERLAIGPDYRDYGLVFTIPGGGPINKDNLTSRTFAHLMEQAKVPRIRFHDLRHTSATLLLAANINPKVVSERLGHGTVGITLDIYSHVLPPLQRDAANEIGRILAGATAK
jgi:integrase